jgi:hypothetical protein
MFKSFDLVCLLAVVCVLTAGCGGPEGPELVPVSGKVLLDGEPVPGAFVQFVPNFGPASGGETIENGEFALMAPGNRAGAVVDSHTVTVSCPFDPSQGSSADGSTQASANGSSCNVPAIYSDVLTSDVTVVVPEEGKSDFVIELSSAADAATGEPVEFDVTSGRMTAP